MGNRLRGFLLCYIPYILCHTVSVILQVVIQTLSMLFSQRRRSQCCRRKQLLLWIFIVVVIVYIIPKITLTPRFIFVNKNVNQKCLIPDLDPFDESVMKYDKTPDPIVCRDKPNLLHVDKGGFLRYNNSAVVKLGIKGLKCEYSVVIRTSGSDDYIRLGETKLVEPPMRVQGDFFRVQCHDINRRTVEDKIYFQVDSESKSKSKTIKPESDNQFSVIFFGIDAVSRLAAIRKLPKTFKFMTDKMQAFDFKGHMKTGDNTLPNVLAMLTGKQILNDELPKMDHSKDFFDNYPFIWYNYSNAGYVSCFSEDYPDVATFNLNKKGFKTQPTDHYMRLFWLGMKNIDLFGTLINSALMGMEDSKIRLKKTSTLCYDNTPKHVLSINYLKEFIERYTGKLRFAFSWISEISHDYINFLGLGDDDILNMFDWMDKNGHFENSFVILGSDHGSRIDLIRNTYVGRIEERMPLLLMSVPKKLKAKYPDIARNLVTNTNRLTTHFDMFETLKAILQSNFQSNINPKLNVERKRGISLFSEVPEYRSCKDAGVPEHYCACYSSADIDVKADIVKVIANFIVSETNRILKPRADVCSELFLKDIKQSQKIELGLQPDGDTEFFSVWNMFENPENQKEERYLLLIETTPGNALLEATVKLGKDGSMSLIDHPSRTNVYGTQSICVKDDDLLKKYCFCNDQRKS